MLVDDFTYIVMVNYCSYHDVVECIDSLNKLKNQSFKLVIVDNNSIDSSCEDLLAFLKKNYLSDYDYFEVQRNNNSTAELCSLIANKKQFLLIASDYNGGFAYGNNLCLRHITQENAFIWMLNPDSIVHPDALTELVTFYSNQNSDCVLGSSIYKYDNRDVLLSLGGYRIDFTRGVVRAVTDRNSPVDYIHGGSLFTRFSVFNVAGLLPEEYFLYWEETDWCIKVRSVGYDLKLVKNSIIYDKVGGSVGRGYLAEYYYTLNALRVISKWKGSRFVYSILVNNVLRVGKRLAVLSFARARAIFIASFHFLIKRY